jgi:hypothetical protein
MCALTKLDGQLTNNYYRFFKKKSLKKDSTNIPLLATDPCVDNTKRFHTLSQFDTAPSTHPDTFLLGLYYIWHNLTGTMRKRNASCIDHA